MSFQSFWKITRKPWLSAAVGIPQISVKAAVAVPVAFAARNMPPLGSVFESTYPTSKAMNCPKPGRCCESKSPSAIYEKTLIIDLGIQGDNDINCANIVVYIEPTVWHLGLKMDWIKPKDGKHPAVKLKTFSYGAVAAINDTNANKAASLGDFHHRVWTAIGSC